MKTKLLTLLALAAALVMGPALAEDKDDRPYSTRGATEFGGPLPEALSEYELTGDTERCFQVTRIRSSRPLDDFHILFRLNNGDRYLSRLNHRCSGLKFEGAYSYSTGIARLCHLEIITVLNTTTGTPRGSCGLGRFEKVVRKGE